MTHKNNESKTSSCCSTSMREMMQKACCPCTEMMTQMMSKCCGMGEEEDQKEKTNK